METSASQPNCSPATIKFSTRAVQAMFNQARFSDMKLIVDETTFYCCRAVMLPLSKYLERFVQWPEDAESDDSERADSSCIVIVDLPDIQMPEGFGDSSAPNKASWFEIYLKAAYGLHKFSKNRVEELFAIAQIADFMISPCLLSICDRVLSSVKFTEENVLLVALYCQQYSLPKTLEALKKVISKNLTEYAFNPLLYKIESGHFADIAKSASTYKWPLWVSAAYASRQVPLVMNWPKLHITDPEMVKWFQDVAGYLIENWDEDETDMEFQNLGCTKITFGPVDSDHAFLYRAIAQHYFDLKNTDP